MINPQAVKSKVLIMTIALTLTACENSELYPAGGAIPLSGGNSGGYSAPAQQPAQRLAPMPIEDPEEEARKMGEHQQTEPVVAGTMAKAEKQCRLLAKGRTLKEVRWFQGNRWDCIFY